MYGTIARLQLKPEAHEQFATLSREGEFQSIPGMVTNYIYRSDNDPNEYYMAVVFTSREAYRQNAESPEQDQRYRRLRELLTADPEWHDGEVLQM